MNKVIKLALVSALLCANIIILSGCSRYNYTKRQINNIKNEINTINDSMEKINELNRERENLPSVNDIAKNAIENAKNNNTSTNTTINTPKDVD